MTDAASVLATCDDYLGLVAALRARVNELGIAVGGEDTARITGLTTGHLAKLMTPQKSGKRFGMVSLGPVLGLLGVKLALIEDEEQTARMVKRIERRLGAYVRSSALHLERPLADFKKMGRLGGIARADGMTAKARSKAARKAALTRHAKGEAAARSARAARAALARWRPRGGELDASTGGETTQAAN